MRIAIFPCNNGLGHIKRSMELAQSLNKKIKIDFYTKKISKYYFKKKKNLSIKIIDNPNSIKDFKKPSFSKWIYNFNLKNYDYIFCDTLPEIILLNKDTIIFANFFWNKIFNLKNKIFKKIEKKLYLSKIFSNYLFFHKPSMKKMKITKVGFFGSFIRNKYLDNRNILISIGTAELINSKILINRIKKIVLKYENYNFYIDKGYYEHFKNFKNISQATHDKKMFSKISVAIIKPGFSIISECLKNGVPIFCFDTKQNAEFRYNSDIIVKNKLGYKENNISKLFDKALNTDLKLKKKIFNRYRNLKWNGEKTIINEFK